MQVLELLQALDLVGQVCRSNNGKKPADAVLKIKAQLVGFEHLQLADWVELRAGQANGARQPAQATVPQELGAILEDLEKVAEDSSTEPVFKKLEALTLSADNWKKLAKLATGLKPQSGRAAKDTLRSYLANRVQLHNRRESIDRVFS